MTTNEVLQNIKEVCIIMHYSNFIKEKSTECQYAWLGDEICDDDNNKAECDYDRGDCCGGKQNVIMIYCNSCQCLDPKYN